MAISKEFIHAIQGLKGLKSNKEYTRFNYRFKLDGREFTKTFDYSKKAWYKKTRKNNAIQDAIKFKDSKENINTAFDLDTKFGYLAKEYIRLKCDTGTKWTQEKETMLEHYIYPHLENRKASTIKEKPAYPLALPIPLPG